MPNEPGHTPGPWSVEPHEYHTAELMGARDEDGYRSYIANLYNTNHRGGDWSLIAAAPDLMGACEYALETLDNETHGNEDAICLLRAALGRARGEVVAANDFQPGEAERGEG